MWLLFHSWPGLALFPDGVVTYVVLPYDAQYPSETDHYIYEYCALLLKWMVKIVVHELAFFFCMSTFSVHKILTFMYKVDLTHLFLARFCKSQLNQS